MLVVEARTVLYIIGFFATCCLLMICMTTSRRYKYLIEPGLSWLSSFKLATGLMENNVVFTECVSNTLCLSLPT